MNKSKSSNNKEHTQLNPDINNDPYFSKPEEIVGDPETKIKELYKASQHNCNRICYAPETIHEVIKAIWVEAYIQYQGIVIGSENRIKLQTLNYQPKLIIYLTKIHKKKSTSRCTNLYGISYVKIMK